jgi:hypothetical protein
MYAKNPGAPPVWTALRRPYAGCPSVEHDNVSGRRFYEKMGFAEPRELTQDVQGYALKLVEYRRPIR